MTLTLASRVYRSDVVRCEAVSDGVVLHHAGSRRDFALDVVGARVWQLLGEDPRLQRAFDRLHDEYAVDDARLRDDLLALVVKMVEAGLVRAE
jgi:hypothetical protein